MALATPILQSIVAFDSATAQTVRFQVTSGDQVVKNRLTIRNNETNVIVYQETVEAFEFSHTIPANTLTNGTYYNCYVNTFNANNVMSADSNIIQFYCLSAPTLEFTNIHDGQILDDASYNFVFRYDQAQGELLNELYLYLYDDHNNLLQTSDLITSQFTPPLTLNYTFTGLEDSKIYHIKAKATTLNGSIVETDIIAFNVKYDYEGGFFKIELLNNCQGGYVEVHGHLIVISGVDESVTYRNSEATLQNGASIEWNEGFEINSDQFIKEKWWSPVLRGQTNVMSSADGRSRIEIEYKRGFPQGATEPKDFIEVRGYYDDVQYFLKRSNYLPIQNNNSRLVSWVKIDGDVLDIRLAVLPTDGSNLEWNEDSDVYWDYLSRLQWNSSALSPSSGTASNIIWNGASNVVYNRITDLYFNDDQSTEPQIPNDDFYNSVEPFKITDIKLTNSVVDHFNITRNVDKAYSLVIPEWEQGTVMNAYMNGNSNAGNIDYSLSVINHIKIKRREVGKLEWITLMNQPVSTIEDMTVIIKDYFIPSGKHFEYAIVPCYNSNEYDYFTLDVTTKFIGVFVSDLDNAMKLFSGATYSQDNYTQDIGILKPFNKVYPVIIHNSQTKFRSLTVTGDILDSNNSFDAEEITEIKNKWINFLTDGKPKFITNWNGDIMLGVLTTPPSFTYKNNCGMVIPQMSFTFTEQGQWNNRQDLLANGYLKGDEDL